MIQTYKKAFEKNINLEIINLSNNSIPTFYFEGLSKLKSLDVSKTKIGMLGDNTFLLMTSLVTLNLNYNFLNTPIAKWFSTLSKLEVLDLSHNVIVALPISLGVPTPNNVKLINLSYNKGFKFTGQTEFPPSKYFDAVSKNASIILTPFLPK